jgi:vacuolar-type H+-ATPase subunit H
MNTFIFLSLVVSTTCLAVVIFVVIFYYEKLARKFHKVQKENLYLRFHGEQRSLEKINTAKDRALQIIQDATHQADEIIKSTHFVQVDSTDSFHKQLEELTNKQKEMLGKVSTDLTVAFDTSIKELEKEDIKIFQDASNDIKRATLEEVEEYKESLKHNTIDAQHAVDEKIQQAFTQAQQEVEEYKKKKIDALDKELFTILEAVAKDIIGKQLTMEDHKDLILKSLEKAKTEFIIPA